jgi:serine/threonine-protein kinase
MASVHLGRIDGAAGFVRTVAIKRLHPHLAHDPEFVSMFVDEARVTGRIKHPNVVALHDVVSEGDELFLVMEYVCGVSLMQIVRHEEPIPLDIASSLLRDMLRGLHAAHEARGADGEPLGIVHRDVSPHNVMVGLDGAARVLDFGIAKAKSRIQTTQDGAVKGKIAYMAPEQLNRKPLSRRTDVYAAGVVAWELLAGEPLFRGETGEIVARILRNDIPPLDTVRDGLPAELDACVRRALAPAPEDRYATARDFADAIEQLVPPASPHAVTDWVERVGGAELQAARRRLEAVESDAVASARPAVGPNDVTQVVALNAPKPPPRGRGRWAFLALPVVALGVAGGIWFRREAPAAPPLATPSPSAVLDVGVASSSAAPSLPAPPAVSIDIPREASAPAPSALAPSARAAAPSVRPAATTKPNVAVSSCDPPTYLDDHGIKRVKAWCR